MGFPLVEGSYLKLSVKKLTESWGRDGQIRWLDRVIRVRYKIPYTLNASYVCITDLKALTLTTVVSFISKWPAVSTFSSLFQSSQISYQIQPKIIFSETGAQNQMLRSIDIYCLISNEAININTSNYQERRAIRDMGPRMMTNQMSPSSGLIWNQTLNYKMLDERGGNDLCNTKDCYKQFQGLQTRDRYFLPKLPRDAKKPQGAKKITSGCNRAL